MVMLQPFHGITRTLNSALLRRFLGVVGDGGGAVHGTLRFIPAEPMPFLRLLLTGCRLANDAADIREAHAIDGVPAMTTARILDGQVVVDGIGEDQVGDNAPHKEGCAHKDGGCVVCRSKVAQDGEAPRSK